MKDTYLGFTQLRQEETEGRDYRIRLRKADSNIAVLAPHGGGIEPGTAEVADAIADGDYTFYAFQGLKPSGNRTLHLTSVRFDEPVGVQAARAAEIAVTVHGCRDQGETVFVGGRGGAWQLRMLQSLQDAGFEAQITHTPERAGRRLSNLCNRCRSGEGVQLELSLGLRKRLLVPLYRTAARRRTDRFSLFVGSVRQAMRGAEFGSLAVRPDRWGPAARPLG
jgi:phage replication-related protein YjqB (UPF0714/DUF867 family)